MYTIYFPITTSAQSTTGWEYKGVFFPGPAALRYPLLGRGAANGSTSTRAGGHRDRLRPRQPRPVPGPGWAGHPPLLDRAPVLPLGRGAAADPRREAAHRRAAHGTGHPGAPP